MSSNKREIAVSIKDIHKHFVLPQSKTTSLKQAAINIVRKNNKTTQKVLDGVSFDIHKGDFFGIVGRNGSGKSTLLKLIAGVYTPTSGSIEVNGGLTPFIELGVGFNPELSGRDNVFLNGALLGFSRDQMREMYDDIVDFAELGPFMDQKLKNYSSGMQVRLAFSIAIKAKNDILIFDEVLAVGDEAFQRKCLDVFEGYKANRQTVVLVTHDMATVKKYCSQAALLSEGRLVSSGNPVVVANEYSRLNQDALDEFNSEKEATKLFVDGGIKVKILNDNNKETSSFSVNDTLRVRIDWKQKEVNRILLDMYKLSGEHVCNFISSREGLCGLEHVDTAGISIKLNLAPGVYCFSVGLWKDDFSKKIEGTDQVGRFTVVRDYTKAPHEFDGVTLLQSKWSS